MTSGACSPRPGCGGVRSDDGTEPALEVVGVTEGETDPSRELLVAAARRAGAGAHRPPACGPRGPPGDWRRGRWPVRWPVSGLSSIKIADDAAHEAIDAAADRRTAAAYYERALGAVREAVSRGTFLREEALRHWQDYVGADDVTRIFSRGIGVVRGAIASLFRPAQGADRRSPDATTDDLTAVARLTRPRLPVGRHPRWPEDRAVCRCGRRPTDSCGGRRPGSTNDSVSGWMLIASIWIRHRRDRRGQAPTGLAARRSG